MILDLFKSKPLLGKELRAVTHQINMQDLNIKLFKDHEYMPGFLYQQAIIWSYNLSYICQTELINL